MYATDGDHSGIGTVKPSDKAEYDRGAYPSC